MKNPTFKKDGKRKIYCPACKYYVKDQYLGEKKDITHKCKNCGSEFDIKHPEIAQKNGNRKLKYGIGDSMFTAEPEPNIDNEQIK
ncbi:hypothetical protein ACFL14_00840 [Patescibacteria group bacterium]